ncbi:MAG TPA: cupin domain-containing protein [Gemmatimonadales bacterium]|nr:cupin domain-containing protein [Gemmatimonadales bacterium]
MYVVTQKDLPQRGMSHAFVGADHGPVGISVYLVEAPPGRGAPLHRHPYEEVTFVRSGRGRWLVEGETRDAAPGDIRVIQAGEVHGFVNTGDEPLVLLSVHLNERFVQENVE